MQSSTHVTTESDTMAGTRPAQGVVRQPDLDSLSSQMQELGSLLQTTLEVDKQIGLFAKAVRGQLAVDGVEYTHRAAHRTCLIGTKATHQATYDLNLQDAALGTLRFFRELPFTDSNLAQLESLLCSLVYPLRNALAYLEALRLASHDPLTGVQNRLAMEKALEREVDLAFRQDSPLSMLVIDVDHFKRFNDRYGHAFGDDVLRALAQAICTTIRRSDLLFRYGGEEFVVLTSHTGSGGARLLAERIRKAIAAMSTIRGREISLSVSLGVAQLAADESADALFSRADHAMYQAKTGGRNRVVVAD